MSKRWIKAPLSISRPHLMEEWDFEKNGELRPEYIGTSSKICVWWYCKQCDYSWRSAVCARSRGAKCPACVKRVAVPKNNLFVNRPDLMKEWDFDRNPQDPRNLVDGTSVKVWWGCEECGYKWKAHVSNRCAGTNCPECNRNKKIDKSKSLGFLFPEVVKEWHPTKNKCSVYEVSSKNGNKYWWLCGVCGYEWKSVVSARTDDRKSGCPSCARTKATYLNNLFVLYPEIAMEWDYSKNVNLTPQKVLPGSAMKVWWLCGVCAQSWLSSIHNRVSHSSGCPYCSSGPISKKSQRWLDIYGIEEKYREHRLKGFGGKIGIIVDGFDPKTNTVYEFLGDYWHGNPDKFKSNKVNKTVGKTFGELYQKWLGRKNLLEEGDYTVVYIWESDFNNR